MKNTKKSQVKKSAGKKAVKATNKAKPVKKAGKAAAEQAKKNLVKPGRAISAGKTRAETPRKTQKVKISTKKSRSAAKSAEKKQVSKPAAKPAKKPAKKPVVKPAKKPAAKTVKNPAKTPVVKPAKKPAAKTAKKPAKKPDVSRASDVAATDSAAHFSAADLEKFRQAMLAMRAKALNKAESLQSQSLVRNDEVNQEEDGTDANMRATELAKANMNERQVRQIDDALKAIADGSYGICKNCGEKIGKARLEARPFAEYCIECQEAIENEQAIRSGFVPLAYYESDR